MFKYVVAKAFMSMLGHQSASYSSHLNYYYYYYYFYFIFLPYYLLLLLLLFKIYFALHKLAELMFCNSCGLRSCTCGMRAKQ